MTTDNRKTIKYDVDDREALLEYARLTSQVRDGVVLVKMDFYNAERRYHVFNSVDFGQSAVNEARSIHAPIGTGWRKFPVVIARKGIILAVIS